MYQRGRWIRQVFLYPLGAPGLVAYLCVTGLVLGWAPHENQPAQCLLTISDLFGSLVPLAAEHFLVGEFSKFKDPKMWVLFFVLQVVSSSSIASNSHISSRKLDKHLVSSVAGIQTRSKMKRRYEQIQEGGNENNRENEPINHEQWLRDLHSLLGGEDRASNQEHKASLENPKGQPSRMNGAQIAVILNLLRDRVPFENIENMMGVPEGKVEYAEFERVMTEASRLVQQEEAWGGRSTSETFQGEVKTQRQIRNKYRPAPGSSQ